jgi:NAD(P)-dependent dehydrogenase (short-subunit alcohol dehydrogenase family)
MTNETTQAMRNRTVLLTGVTSDIGTAYLHALTAAGANVVATDLPGLQDDGQSVTEKASAAGPGQAVFVPCDVTDEDAVQRSVATAMDRFGALHSVINNAAIYKTLGEKRPLTELSCDDWDRVLRVNVRGTWQVIKACAPALAASGDGRIVNISSVVARKGSAGFAHYVASKAAVEGLTRAAARELGGGGTTVNAVAPGLVDNAATRTLNTDDYLTSALRSRSLPRAMASNDLVGAVLWLAGPDSGFVTGQVLVVDGGGLFV